MALNAKTAVLVRNGALDFLTTHIGSNPVMRWYDGTQPADADTALSSNTLIVTMACSATLAAAASAGVLTLNAITGANAVATGNPVTFGSLLTSAFVRKVDFSINSTGNMTLNSYTVGSGAACSVTSFTVTMAA